MLRFLTAATEAIFMLIVIIDRVGVGKNFYTLRLSLSLNKVV